MTAAYFNLSMRYHVH